MQTPRRGRKLPAAESVETLFGKTLLEILDGHDRTMRDVADAIGVDHSTLVHVVRGSRASPKLLGKLVGELGRVEGAALLSAHLLDEIERCGGDATTFELGLLGATKWRPDDVFILSQILAQAGVMAELGEGSPPRLRRKK